MTIQHLHIENFRGIRQLDLDLAAPVTVLVGENGAGKSSILDCLATLLSWYPARLRSPKGVGARFKQTDIRIAQRTASASIRAAIEEGDGTIEWGQRVARTGSGTSGKVDVAVLTEEVQARYPGMFFDSVPPYTGTPRGWPPLCVHYSVNRTVLDIPLRIRGEINLKDRSLAFAGAFNANVNFRTFFSWYRQREDWENEMQREEWLDPHKWLDPQLQAVRQAIHTFTGFANLRVRRSPLHMEVTKGLQSLWVNHLSDGEKCLLSMIGDLARRLAILSGEHLSNPLHAPGMILIDEIDLHLHPAWQRRIIPKLVETFPNCQFIVSTHSPQVISDVRPEAVFLLRQVGDTIVVTHPEDSFGQSSDRILEDLMRVSARPVEIKEALRSLFEQISRGDLDTAERDLALLQQQIGSDPELTWADTTIRRKRVLGE